MTNNEIVNKHYSNFLHICKRVTNDHEYQIDLCNELCLYILEKVDNKFLNSLEDIDVGEDRTKVSYFFFGAAFNKWNYFVKYRDRNKSRDSTDNNRINFVDMDSVSYKLFQEQDKTTLEDVLKHLNDADKGFVDLFIRSNGYKRTMSEKSGLDVKSLNRYEDKLIKKIKRNV